MLSRTKVLRSLIPFVILYILTFVVEYQIFTYGNMFTYDIPQKANSYNIIKQIYRLTKVKSVENLYIRIDRDLSVSIFLQEKIPFANIYLDSKFSIIDKNGDLISEGVADGRPFIFGNLSKSDIQNIYNCSFQDFFNHCKYILMLRKNSWKIQLKNNIVILCKRLDNIDERIKKKFPSYDLIPFAKIDLRDERKIVLY